MKVDAERRGKHSHAERGNEGITLTPALSLGGRGGGEHFMNDPPLLMRTVQATPRVISGLIVLCLCTGALGDSRILAIRAQPAADDAPLVRADVPKARCAVVSDAAQLLIVGAQDGHDGLLLVFALDAQGQLTAADPLVVKLPAPASLAEFFTYPLSLVTHPTRPVLYVWQEVVGQRRREQPDDEVVYRDFDHLQVYEMDGGALRHVGSHARGDTYDWGNAAGSMALDAANHRLYLPNVQHVDSKGRQTSALAYAHLDPQDLPLLDHQGVLERTVQRAPAFIPERFPRPRGVAPVSRDVAMFGISHGVVSWVMAEKRAVLSAMQSDKIFGTVEMAAHPTLGVLYLAQQHGSRLNRIEHAEGYVTMMPSHADLSGGAIFSPPVVMGAAAKVAVGGPSRVYFVDIDEQGRFTGQAQEAPVRAARVQCLAYSPRFGLVYVPQDPDGG